MGSIQHFQTGYKTLSLYYQNWKIRRSLIRIQSSLTTSNNNQLQHLKVIPKPIKNNDRYAYISTALAFKNSIEKLVLLDQETEVDSARCYYLLRSKLTEFRALKKLKINIESKNSIIKLDKIIQDCPLLTSLKINIDLISGTPSNERHDTLLYVPRPNSKVFKGRWDIIQTDESLNYFMHKFPNLERLVLQSSDYFCSQSKTRWYHLDNLNYHKIYKFSGTVLLNLFEYLLKIPYLDINLLFRDDITSCWVNLIKESSAGVTLITIKILGPL